MSSVFQGFYKEIDIVSKRIRHTEQGILESHNDCCRYNTDVADHIKYLKGISNAVMSVAEILDMRGDKDVLKLIYSCKFWVTRVHNMCKLAYIKDASKGYKRVLVSLELESCIREYSSAKTEDYYTIPRGTKEIEVVISDDVKGITVVPVIRRDDEWM